MRHKLRRRKKKKINYIHKRHPTFFTFSSSRPLTALVYRESKDLYFLTEVKAQKKKKKKQKQKFYYSPERMFSMKR